MTIGLADIAGQCTAHGLITAIYMMDVDSAALPDHWYSGYADGDISGVTAVQITPTQGFAEVKVAEKPGDPGRAYRATLTCTLSKGQQGVDELAARLLHAEQVHIIYTDQQGVHRIMEYARGRFDFSIGRRLGDAQRYNITFTATDAAPPRIYSGTLPI